MTEINATNAARNFSELLDAVEHRGEHFTIVRRGKVIAQLEPVTIGSGADLKALLRHRKPDSAWLKDVAATRELVAIEERT
jgi:antitoxin (DNA-binding transcriptional repressor) of toxin-antitoxin stability system